MNGRARGLANIQIRPIDMLTTEIVRKGRNHCGRLGLSKISRCHNAAILAMKISRNPAHERIEPYQVTEHCEEGDSARERFQNDSGCGCGTGVPVRLGHEDLRGAYKKKTRNRIARHSSRIRSTEANERYRKQRIDTQVFTERIFDQFGARNTSHDDGHDDHDASAPEHQAQLSHCQ
jgi:hypothetical protein